MRPPAIAKHPPTRQGSPAAGREEEINITVNNPSLLQKNKPWLSLREGWYTVKYLGRVGRLKTLEGEQLAVGQWKHMKQHYKSVTKRAVGR